MGKEEGGARGIIDGTRAIEGPGPPSAISLCTSMRGPFRQLYEDQVPLLVRNKSKPKNALLVILHPVLGTVCFLSLIHI